MHHDMDPVIFTVVLPLLLLVLGTTLKIIIYGDEIRWELENGKAF